MKKIVDKQIEVTLRGKNLLKKLWKGKKLGGGDYLTMALVMIVLVVIVAWPALKTIVTTLTTNISTWQTANWTKIFTNLP